MIQLLGAIVRGLRSRALLSAGSVLLTALAIGSAVLGPVFSEAVTNSYIVTRLQETPAGLTGISRVFTPDSTSSVEQAERDAAAASDAVNRGPWAPSVTTVESARFMALRGSVRFWSTGRCVREPRGDGPLPGARRRGADARRRRRDDRCHAG